MPGIVFFKGLGGAGVQPGRFTLISRVLFLFLRCKRVEADVLRRLFLSENSLQQHIWVIVSCGLDAQFSSSFGTFWTW